MNAVDEAITIAIVKKAAVATCPYIYYTFSFTPLLIN
jgi:hypothetical protein